MDAPLFIIGTGRCGSTVVHDLVAAHPRLSWLSPLCNRYPGKPAYNRWLMRLATGATMSRLVQRVFYPIEAYHFWDHYYAGFSMPCRDLTGDDITPKQRAALRRVLPRLTSANRPRLLCKITGWPRVGLLNHVFPDARFVHVTRDGRATAASLLHVRFWQGWRGPEHWRFGPLNADQAAQWESHGRSFVALAAIQWDLLMCAYESARSRIPADRWLDIKYEDLCRDPKATLRRVTDFASLEFPPSLRNRLAATPLRNTNDKWRKDLTPAQQAMLNDLLTPGLRRWGYA